MLDKNIIKKLKKVLNPEKFRFVVILYDTSNDIANIKEFIKNEYPYIKHKTLDLENEHYSDFTNELYSNNKFIYIENFAKIFEDQELYSLFNQRRDKLASYNSNLLFFYPKKLQTKLYQDALNFIPDLWEFRSAVIEVKSKESELINIEIKEDLTFLKYSGMNQHEKLEEIERLKQRLDSVVLDIEKVSIITDMGFLYQELAEYQKALPLYIKAVKISEKILGGKHPDTATTYNNLAELYSSMGEYEKALLFYEKNLKINQKIFGKKHLSTATSYNNLALAYHDLGNYIKALDISQEALKIRENILGKNNLVVATSYNNIAGLYRLMGNYEKALPLYKKSLKISEDLLGLKHIDTAIRYNNLAGCYTFMSENKKALPLYLKSLEIREELLGKNHISMSRVYNNLARLYTSLGEYKKALPLFKKSIKIREELLGGNHPDTAMAYNNLAIFYYTTMDFKMAHLYVKKALNIFIKTLPTDHPNLINSKQTLLNIEDKLKIFLKIKNSRIEV